MESVPIKYKFSIVLSYCYIKNKTYVPSNKKKEKIEKLGSILFIKYHITKNTLILYQNIVLYVFYTIP